MKSSEQQDWCFPLSYSPIRDFVYKSFVNFNLQFVRVGCKLLRAIYLPIKIAILQCCSQENIRFDCKGWSATRIVYKLRMIIVHTQESQIL
jgi:hypothetical protein